MGDWRFTFEVAYSNAAGVDNIGLLLPTTGSGRNTIFPTSIGVGFGIGSTPGGKEIGDWVIGIDGTLEEVGNGVVGITGAVAYVAVGGNVGMFVGGNAGLYVVAIHNNNTMKNLSAITKYKKKYNTI